MKKLNVAPGGIISAVISVLLCALVYYLCLPALSLRSEGFWWFMMLVLFCAGTTVFMFSLDAEDEDVPFRVGRIACGIVAGGFAVFMVLCLISSNMFQADKARTVAKVTVSEATIKEVFPDLTEKENLKEFPLVDLDTADLLGDKKIAGIAHASWYDVDDEYNLIKYQGKYYRLSVIDYGGLFKYNKARHNGCPGYVLVEVTPDNGRVVQDATVVLLDQTIQYSPGAFWSHDLRRHLRNQYSSYIFDESYLEIDETGTPYWVTGVKRATAGLFGVKTVTSFILTNAQTGESSEFKVQEAPEWIDHVFSLNYLMKVAEWHYSYVGGFWNNVFSKTNVWRTSYYYRTNRNPADTQKTDASQYANFFGYNSTLDRSGQVVFYTGLTAANNAESNLAWLEIDTSTGEMVQYEILGAEESSAQAAVEALVQEKGYEATFPLPANIGGYPSYIMCLKGKAGLVQCYGICNVENYSLAVVADTLDEAINKYMATVKGEEYSEPEPTEVVEEPEQPDQPESVAFKKESGTIEAIYTAEIEGTTQFYYVVDGNLYRAPITVNERQLFLKEGDGIKFEYYEADGVNIIVSISGGSMITTASAK